ncbi:MAG: hypothetical protein GEV28_18470 [Actinophytocola sp.]|uniref:hypothetical protein n=1 Tax=Actinophytocola sp. TaxID=1872138 RepID=UPI00132B4C1B|nr:hypothetical protein [Actinophytocola sp.]MPZ82270.1 hypothetical protein [Actinophytocola sp.]
MQRATRLPDDTKLVVHPNRGSAVREQLPSTVVFALTTVAAGFGVAATGAFGGWLVIGVLCAFGVVLELLVLRSEIALGPALAADAEHVWVRVGGFLRPASMRLDWAEITTVGLRTWQGRRNATARYLTILVTDEAKATLDGELAGVLDRRMRRLATTFGSPLAISAKHKAETLDDTVRGLGALAPDGVRFTSA